MRNDTMRKKLESDKARLLNKIEVERAAHARKVDPLQQQVGLLDRMLAEVDAFEKAQPATTEEPSSTSTDDLPSFLKRPA